MHLGISAEPEEAVDICRAKLDGEELYQHIDLLSLGFLARDDAQPELASLLKVAGIDVTIHPVELNVITEPSPSVVAMLDAWVASLDPLWLEQDGALWVWGQQAYLASQIVTPPFSDAAARRLAETTGALAQRWGRPFLVENPPVFAKAGDLMFYDFLDRIRVHGGGLTLDIGHAIGAQLNTGEPVVVPDDDWAGWDAVKSVHLSGQQVLTTGRGRVWMDAHGSEFSVQQLRYAAQVLQRGRAVRALTLEMEGASREVVRRNFAHVRALMREVDVCAC